MQQILHVTHRPSPAIAPLRIWLAILLLGWSLTLPAASAIPDGPLPVSDLTGSLSSDQQQALSGQILALEQQTGSQLAVLIVPTTGEESIEQFSLRVAGQWQLGRKDVDDGVLLLLAKDDRTLRIEVGYGLEGTLSDAVSKRIISESMLPQLRQGEFYAAIHSGVSRIAEVIRHEPATLSPATTPDSPDLTARVVLAVVLAIIMALLVNILLPKRWPSPLAMALSGLASMVAAALLLQDALAAGVSLLLGSSLGLLGSLFLKADWFSVPVGQYASGQHTEHDTGSFSSSTDSSSSSSDSSSDSSFSNDSGGDFGGGGASDRW